ncbi:MAG: hypothetical protein LBP59_00130 [Planctomycetaceae bacterium]|nr:hypothetical protein [Planctomycetaceae bacterium]
MRNIFVLFFAVCLMVSFSGCDDDAETTSTSTNAPVVDSNPLINTTPSAPIIDDIIDDTDNTDDTDDTDNTDTTDDTNTDNTDDTTNEDENSEDAENLNNSIYGNDNVE